MRNDAHVTYGLWVQPKRTLSSLEAADIMKSPRTARMCTAGSRKPTRNAHQLRVAPLYAMRVDATAAPASHATVPRNLPNSFVRTHQVQDTADPHSMRGVGDSIYQRRQRVQPLRDCSEHDGGAWLKRHATCGMKRGVGSTAAVGLSRERCAWLKPVEATLALWYSIGGPEAFLAGTPACSVGEEIGRAATARLGGAVRRPHLRRLTGRLLGSFGNLSMARVERSAGAATSRKRKQQTAAYRQRNRPGPTHRLRLWQLVDGRTRVKKPVTSECRA